MNVPMPPSVKPEPAGLTVSFEFFPPKTEKMEQSLWQAVRRLAPLAPAFVSVTYGAGGTTRERTHATVTRLQAETGLVAAAHLTCVGAPRAEINRIALAYWQAGIRHIVALRGDPIVGALADDALAPRDGYRYAAELVAGLGQVAPFEISVAAYPEVHPEARSAADDLDNLKRKIDAGATRAITQFFFDTEAFIRFVDRARSAGIAVPIVPGILPITNFSKTVEFAGRCGARVPGWMAELFDGLDGDPETRQLVAANVAVEQCRKLIELGFREFHFYTLNRAELTFAICHMLGLRAKPALSLP
ncbi:MAG: methylenetetrahydrofolate reductase [NAD(P)H] [Azospirillaceae bacterium]|nr:methylenetetrahydrofolate reductase [NAD(P)H] [Azospirillaceae bacterium]